MKLYILDADHVSLFQREHPHVISKVKETPPTQLAVTIITLEEQLRGRLAQIRRASQKASPPESLIKAFAELKKTVQYFNDIQTLDFDSAADARFRNLHQQKFRVGTQDLRIAAIVLSNSGILVTRNRQDFERIPGLIVEDWSQIQK